MIDYETIFIDEHSACEASFPPDQLFATKVQQASLDAGIAAVVAAAKREALEEAAGAYEVDPDVTYFPKIVGHWLRQRAEMKRGNS